MPSPRLQGVCVSTSSLANKVNHASSCYTYTEILLVEMYLDERVVNSKSIPSSFLEIGCPSIAGTPLAQSIVSP